MIKELGIAAVPHGFRSSFRDWAAERTNTPREVVEAALAHTVHHRGGLRPQCRDHGQGVSFEAEQAFAVLVDAETQAASDGLTPSASGCPHAVRTSAMPPPPYPYVSPPRVTTATSVAADPANARSAVPDSREEHHTTLG